MKNNFQVEPPPIEINGRKYPLWSQFVHRKEEWIGGVLQDFGDYSSEPKYTTKITDIKLEANGPNHAYFSVVGENFTCGFCTSVGGVSPGEAGWMTVSGYQNHTWRFKKKDGNEREKE